MTNFLSIAGEASNERKPVIVIFSDMTKDFDCTSPLKLFTDVNSYGIKTLAGSVIILFDL